MNHPNHCHHSDLVFVLLVVLTLLVALVVPAEAGLPEAHQQALAVYKKTKDPHQAINVLEEAGVKGVLDKKPAGMKDAAYVDLLNDYGFFLSETSDRYAEAIPILQRVISLDPKRHVAFLNLGDSYRKAMSRESDPRKTIELKRLVRHNYDSYVRLLREKGLQVALPERVRQALSEGEGQLRQEVQKGIGVQQGGIPQYELVMSKDQKVCSHFLKLFNDDLRREKAIAYDKHPEFTSIEWKRMGNVGADLDFREMEIAEFDINNDGLEDLVVKGQWSIHNELGDQLYIYQKTETAPPLRDSFGLAELKQYDGQVYKDQTYYLKAFARSGRKHRLAAPFVLYPFKFDQSFYISMKDLAHKFGAPENWHIVTRYQKPNDLQDVCYYRMTSIGP